jgi:DMSO/TMAO reductase YedYZ molybdopterin-dependent catalytic subunit
MTRRREILMGLAGAAVTGLVPPARAAMPSGAVETGVLDALAGKKPLVKRSFRPPNYETPLEYFNSLYTPNDAFFVRYHLAAIPEVSTSAWRLRVGGDAVSSPREYALDDLRRQFELVEIAAVNQCSGNRRGLFEPNVPGIQWGYGGMGNARWRGVRLKDLLAKAGVRTDALEVVLDGADGPVMPATPDFVKSIPVAKALEANTLVAFEMNGEPLPRWNGAPARLVVPGWTATYWVKHLADVRVTAKTFDGFWMKTAYRVPAGAFPWSEAFASQATEANTPVTSIAVNSLVTNVASGQKVGAGRTLEVKGIAWDGGSGIRTVEVSADGGKSWRAAKLGEDAGPFSFRQWTYPFSAATAGRRTLAVRATSRSGAVQGTALVPNPSGYHHNLVQSVDVDVV